MYWPVWLLYYLPRYHSYGQTSSNRPLNKWEMLCAMLLYWSCLIGKSHLWYRLMQVNIPLELSSYKSILMGFIICVTSPTSTNLQSTTTVLGTKSSWLSFWLIWSLDITWMVISALYILTISYWLICAHSLSWDLVRPIGLRSLSPWICRLYIPLVL